MMAGGMPESVAMEMAKNTVEKSGGISLGMALTVPGVFHTPHFNLGLFHESNISITDRLNATIGLRYDFSQTEINYDTKALMAMTAKVMGKEATYTLSSHLLSNAKTTSASCFQNLDLHTVLIITTAIYMCLSARVIVPEDTTYRCSQTYFRQN